MSSDEHCRTRANYVRSIEGPSRGRQSGRICVPIRFHFDIENGKETIRDEQGVEAETLAEALDEARSVIDEMAEELGMTDLGSPWTLIVRDATGTLVGRLPIKP